MPPRPTYPIVVPIFNEEAGLPPLLAAARDPGMQQLDGPAEVIFVDDGRRDPAPAVIEAADRIAS